jgi:hypothetical protein
MLKANIKEALLVLILLLWGGGALLTAATAAQQQRVLLQGSDVASAAASSESQVCRCSNWLHIHGRFLFCRDAVPRRHQSHTIILLVHTQHVCCLCLASKHITEKAALKAPAKASAPAV